MNRYSKATYRITVIAMCVAFFTLCSWLSIPFFIEFTLQLFAIFLIASTLKPLICVLSVLSYVALGLVGVPVFAGFKSGFSAFMGPSGGFIIGFLLSAVLISLFAKLYAIRTATHFTLMLVSLLICYACGVLWYIFVFNYSAYTPLSEALLICVVPYIIPDILKIFLVRVIYKKLDPYFKRLDVKMYF